MCISVCISVCVCGYVCIVALSMDLWTIIHRTRGHLNLLMISNNSEVTKIIVGSFRIPNLTESVCHKNNIQQSNCMQSNEICNTLYILNLTLYDITIYIDYLIHNYYALGELTHYSPPFTTHNMSFLLFPMITC